MFFQLNLDKRNAEDNVISKENPFHGHMQLGHESGFCPYLM